MARRRCSKHGAARSAGAPAGRSGSPGGATAACSSCAARAARVRPARARAAAARARRAPHPAPRKPDSTATGSLPVLRPASHAGRFDSKALSECVQRRKGGCGRGARRPPPAAPLRPRTRLRGRGPGAARRGARPRRQRRPGRVRRRAPPAGRPTPRRAAGPPRERPRPPGGGGGIRAQRPPAGMPAHAAATVRMRAGERAGPKARARAGSAPCPSPGRSRGTAARPPARRRRSPAPARQRPIAVEHGARARVAAHSQRRCVGGLRSRKVACRAQSNEWLQCKSGQAVPRTLASDARGAPSKKAAFPSAFLSRTGHATIALSYDAHALDACSAGHKEELRKHRRHCMFPKGRPPQQRAVSREQLVKRMREVWMDGQSNKPKRWLEQPAQTRHSTGPGGLGPPAEGIDRPPSCWPITPHHPRAGQPPALLALRVGARAASQEYRGIRSTRPQAPGSSHARRQVEAAALPYRRVQRAGERPVWRTARASGPAVPLGRSGRARRPRATLSAHRVRRACVRRRQSRHHAAAVRPHGLRRQCWQGGRRGRPHGAVRPLRHGALPVRGCRACGWPWDAMMAARVATSR